jgi:pimeloyl-ACP methyl ester carboxylesterase
VTRTPFTGEDDSAQAIVHALDVQADRFVTPCGGHCMIWRRWGAGPPLLMFHGAHGSWTHWIRNIARLSQGRSLWVPDLPGFGDSALPPNVSGDGIATVIAAGLKALPIQSDALEITGFSTGAVIAAHLAAIAPSMVRRLIIVDGGGLSTPLGDLTMQSVRNLATDAATRAAHRQNLLTVMLHHPASADALALYIQMRNVARGRIDARPLVLPDRLERALARSDVPVDAIWGEHDRPHPDPMMQLERLSRFRPAARLRIVRNAGHWCPYENQEGFLEAFGSLGH